jgi:hypothetical protein
LSEHISIDERRAHPRVAAELELQGSPEDGGVVARMVTSDLSMGGLYCVSTADFPEMTRMAVRLMLPGNGNGSSACPLDLEAVVVRRVRLNASNGDPRFELALFFTHLEDDARKRLQKFLAH